MLCGVFVIVKFHIEKRKDGLTLPMIEYQLVAYMNVFGVTKFQLFTTTNSQKSVGWGVWKPDFQVEIEKSTRWRHLCFHKQSINAEYEYVPVSWLAVGGGATGGPHHLLIMLNL